MRALLTILTAMFTAERRSFLRGLALAALVLLMGAALFGLSGWFITAATAAGLAGAGLAFDASRPAAFVRYLALGRTAARYGERLFTHDATLRALSQLRIRLLRGLLDSPWRALERLRANAFLNRVTADIDALDGLALRLVLPGLAGNAAILIATAALWALVHPAVALLVGGGYLIGPFAVFLLGTRQAQKPSRQAEAALQATRSRLIDLIAARDDLAVYGQLQTARDHVATAQARHHQARDRLDRIERRSSLALDLTGAAVTAGALALGAHLAQAGSISAAQAAIGVFVALALAEAVGPVARAMSELGRMLQAARRVAPAITEQPAAVHATHAPGPGGALEITGLTYRHGPDRGDLFHPLSFAVAPGETVALTGPSGSGKSTVLLIAAGCLPPGGGRVCLGDTDVTRCSRKKLNDRVTLVPQRHALISGSVAQNLRLAAPEAGDDALWAALDATALRDTVADKGGLDAMLGFRGAGLSGGEARRLVLARALLRKPDLLLLDEPTEGLDQATAAQVMQGLRRALPDAAILIAAHRPGEIEAADRAVAIDARD